MHFKSNRRHMEKLIKLYGERNTNTTYMAKVIRENLSAEIMRAASTPTIRNTQKHLPGNEWLNDLYFHFNFKHNLGWKHACVKPLSELEKYDVYTKDLFFLTITKNPYSWLLSLHRNPYHAHYKIKPDFEEFITAPWKTMRRDNCGKILNNPMELWNIKNSSYLRLDDKKCIHATSESIFESPELLIDIISSKFSIEKKHDKFVDFVQPAKKKSKDTSYYRNYYLNELWRENLSKDELSIINESLDFDLMKHYGYEVIT